MPERVGELLERELEMLGNVPDAEFESVAEVELGRLSSVPAMELVGSDEELGGEIESALGDVLARTELEKLDDGLDEELGIGDNVKLVGIGEGLDVKLEVLLEVALEISNEELDAEVEMLTALEVEDCVKMEVLEVEATGDDHKSVDELSREVEYWLVEDKTVEDGLLLNDDEDEEVKSDKDKENEPVDVCAVKSLKALELCSVEDPELVELCTRGELELVELSAEELELVGPCTEGEDEFAVV